MRKNLLGQSLASVSAELAQVIDTTEGRFIPTARFPKQAETHETGVFGGYFIDENGLPVSMKGPFTLEQRRAKLGAYELSNATITVRDLTSPGMTPIYESLSLCEVVALARQLITRDGGQKDFRRPQDLAKLVAEIAVFMPFAAHLLDPHLLDQEVRDAYERTIEDGASPLDTHGKTFLQAWEELMPQPAKLARWKIAELVELLVTPAAFEQLNEDKNT